MSSLFVILYNWTHTIMLLLRHKIKYEKEKKMKRRLGLIMLSLILLAGLVIGIAVTASADSSVADSDWLKAPGKSLVKCPGGKCDHTACDYVYSFAVVGDTQNLNIADVRDDNAAYMATLYNWILSNKDEKNIQYVLGLGDITQAYHRGYSNGIWVEEWLNAAEAVSLLDGKIDYSLVRGNHDISDATDGFNAVFGSGDKLANGVDNQYYENLLALSQTTDSEGRPMAGFRNASKIEDTYRKITIGGHKYIIFTLDWHPTKAGEAVLAAGEQDCLTWMDEVLAANSDHKAIITLHAFIMRDGSFIDDVEDVFPYENLTGSREDWSEVSSTGGNSTIGEVWDVLRKHANVEMVLCGHVDEDNIITTQLRGDNGNTVTCMLIDGQTIDSTIEPVGMVAMFYVKADGAVVNVEYISTVRATAGKNAYLRDENQFEVDLDYTADEGGWTETPYGFIPTAIYKDYTFHVLLDDDSDTSTVNTLFGSYNSWEETLSAIHAFNGISAMAAREIKTYNIVMSRDYTYNNEITSSQLDHNQSCNNPGKTVLDLGTHTLTLNSGMTFLPYYNATKSIHPGFEIKNGNIALKGTARLVVTQHGHPVNANDSSIDLDLTDLNITYASGATGSLITYFDGSDNGPSFVNVNVTNCQIDASAAGTVTLFNLKDTKNNSDVSLNMTGGSIIGTTAANTTLFTRNFPGDSVTFSKDSAGKYTTVTLSDSADIGGVYYSDVKDTYLEFGTPVSSSGKYVYSLETSSSLLTKYGHIPLAYADETSYPFVLFKNGEMIHAASDWKKLIDTDIAGNEAYQSGCTLLLRKNYVTGTDSSGSPSWFFRIDDLTIDLGGFTFSRGSAHMFQFMGTEATAHETKIVIQNGTIKAVSNTAPIAFNNADTNTAADTLDLTLEGITYDISEATGSQGLLVAFGDGVKQGINAAVTLNDCKIYRGSSTRTVTLFGLIDEKIEKVNNKTDITVTINGGELVANTMNNLTFATFSPIREGMTASADKVFLGKGADGNYLTVKLPSTYTAPTTAYAFTDGNRVLAKNVDDGTSTYYTFDSVSTAYGDVSYQYASNENYPFAVFYNGQFKGAYASYNKAIGAAVALIDTDSEVKVCDTAYVVLRRDFVIPADDHGYFSGARGNLILDLQGYTISSASSAIASIAFNYNNISTEADAQKYLTYTSNITVKNGTIKNNRSGLPIFAIDQSGTTTVAGAVAKKIYFGFDNVTFRTGSQPIIHNYDKVSSHGLDISVSCNNCTFDFTGASSGATMISLFNRTVRANVELIGCKVIAGKLNDYNIYRIGDDDTATVSKGADESYLTVTQTSSTAPTNVFTASDGSLIEFTLTSSNATANKYVYSLMSNSFTVGGYGNVPSDFVDKTSYPLLLFYNGEFVDGYTTFSNAIAKAKTLVDTADERAVCDTVYIVMRTDIYSVSESINLMTLLGKVVVDLQGNTLYNASTSTTGFINSYINYNGVNSASVAEANLSNPAEITFKNGTVRNEGSYHMFGFDMEEKSVLADQFSDYSAKKITYNFDNVEFRAVKKEIMRNWNKTGEGIDVNVNINNCTFNYTGMTANLSMFNCTGTDIVYDIRFTGTTNIIATDLNSYKLYNKAEKDKIAITGPVILTQTTNTTPTFTYENGVTSSFILQSSADGKYVYELGVNSAYGFIGSMYANPVAYPFAVFGMDGSLIGGYATFGEAAIAAGLIAGTTEQATAVDCVILFRNDYAHTAGVGHVSKYYHNVIIDLGGFTVTMTTSFLGCYFDGDLNGGSSTLGKITIRNGSFVADYTSNSYSIIRMDNATGATAISYDVDLENVKISTAKTKTPPYVAVSTAGNSTGTVNVVFTDCIFDYTQATTKCYMSASGNAGKINATVVGGQIIAGNKNTFSYIDTTNKTFGLAYYPGSTNDTLTLLKNDKGEYVQLVLDNGTAAPTGIFKIADGVECVFVKASSDDKLTTYRLTPKAALDQNFIPEASITLGAELTFNIYLPMNENLTALTLDGAPLDISKLTVKDGYYLVTVNLGARDAARSISLVASLTVNGKTMRGTFTFSIPKYAEKVIEDSDISAVEKTLVKDVLSYIRAAYAYFGTNDTEALAKIDELLGENYDEASAPVMNGSQEKPTLGITAVTYNLNAKPAVRFYIADSLSLESFTFSIGGNAVSAIEGTDSDGKRYVEVLLYAYEMAETIDYTVAGVSDSCHIKCYYEWAKTQNNDDLTKLVVRFAKYCESAAAYRESVLA